MMPFQGLYLHSNDRSLRTHLYPVPDPRFPFLGVHFTMTADGRAKIGPTARPVGLGAWRLLLDKTLRAQAVEELRKTSRAHILRRAAVLAEPRDVTTWGTPGVRAQLYDVEKRALEMDFVLEGDERSLHILNVVSPGLTCALSFAEYVVTRRSAQGTHPR